MSSKEQQVRRMAERLNGEAPSNPWWAGAKAAQDDPYLHFSDGALLMVAVGPCALDERIRQLAQEMVAADCETAQALAAAILEVNRGETTAGTA